MLLKYRSDVRISEIDWRLLETSPASLNIVLRRVIKAVPGLFGRTALEIFVSDKLNDMIEKDTQGLIFARSARVDLIEKIQKIHGIKLDPLAIIDRKYINGLIDEELKAYAARIEGIGVDSFVRLRDGFTRDYCGTVRAIDQRGIATVTVSTMAIDFLVKTPIGNLEDLSYLPASQRVFFSSAKGGDRWNQP